MATGEKCIHCRTRTRSCGRRGLCHHCHQHPEIREQYLASPIRYIHVPEPTEDEVEALVAAGMANLPEWWEESSMRQRRKDERRRTQGADE